MAVSVSLELSPSARTDGSRLVRLVLVGAPHPRVRYALDGCYVHPKQWDAGKKRVRPGSTLSAAINERIGREFERAQGIVTLNPYWSPAQVRDALKRPEVDHTVTLAAAMQAAFDANLHRWRYGTRKGRMTVIRDAQAVVPAVPLASFGQEHVRHLEKHYIGRGLASNTRRSRLRRFSTMYLLACELYGLQPAVRLAKVAPAEVKTLKTFLTAEEVERLRIASWELPTAHLRLAAHSWLLQYDLGGLRFNEVCRLSKDMKHGNAYRWIEGKVMKPRYHPITDKAAAIIAYYQTAERKRVLPLVADGLMGDEFDRAVESANASINMALRKVCELLGLPRVTTHNARHSAAQRIKQATDIHTASRILGHATIKQTQGYLNDLDTSEIEAAFRKLT